MHPSHTSYMKSVSVSYFPRNVFLATKDQLLIFTFREWPGVFLLLDISVASDTVVFCDSEFFWF